MTTKVPLESEEDFTVQLVHHFYDGVLQSYHLNTPAGCERCLLCCAYADGVESTPLGSTRWRKSFREG